MTRTSSATLLLALLASVANLEAQGRGTIGGVVMGPTGSPQPNITIIVTNAQGIDRRAVSDADGQFVFGGLQAGVYRLRTDDETFAPFSQDQITVVGGQTFTVRIALQSRVPVAAPQTARATLQGTVIGPEGRPIGNTTIVLTNPQGIDRRAVSEPTGAYVFGGLQPGTYRLRIEDPGASVRPFPADRGPARARRAASIRRSSSTVAAASATTGRARRQRTAGTGGPARAGAESGTGCSSRAAAARSGSDRAGRRFRSGAQPVVLSVGAVSTLRARAETAVGCRHVHSIRTTRIRRRPTFRSAAARSLFANVNLQLNSAFNPRTVGAGEPVSEVFYNNNFVGGVEIFRGDDGVRAQTLGGARHGRRQREHERRRQATAAPTASKKRSAKSGSRCSVPRSTSCRSAAACRTSTATSAATCSSTTSSASVCSATRASNRDQYNVAYFSMRDRDPVSQLHKFTSRNQDVVIANYYIQDFGTPGYTFMFNVHVNRDRGVPERSARAAGHVRRLPRRREVGTAERQPRVLRGVRAGR